MRSRVFYVYVDWTTEETPRPYYVGKGDRRRLGKTYRNAYHSNIKNRYGFDRRIVLETHDEDEAFELESDLIAQHKTYVYGGEGFWGANFTVGGEGASLNGPRPLTDEQRFAIGCGRRGKTCSDQHRARLSQSRRGMKLSAEARANIGRASRNRSKETKQKIGDAHRGRVRSEETKEKMRNSWRDPERAKLRRDAMRQGWENRRLKSKFEKEVETENDN